jgi:phosphinothricin acetyltransferase
LGFVRVAHFKQVGYKFGQWLDVVFLQLMLKAGCDPSRD